ncbi:MAG: hypothetical protein HC906_17655 [Bacteroidales bacterium]|nr:hypothetical protein [Bacteroidales bacterium]
MLKNDQDQIDYADKKQKFKPFGIVNKLACSGRPEIIFNEGCQCYRNKKTTKIIPLSGLRTKFE